MMGEGTMTGLAQLGKVMQIAYVPADFDGALRFWTQVMGVGPFFLQPNLSPPGSYHRGQPTDAVFSIAIAYWGDVQVELVQQHNDGPSIYKEWRDAGHEGMHHSCILVDDIAEAQRAAEAAGGVIAQEIRGQGWGVFYADMGGGPGTMIEVMQASAATLERFAIMKQASIGWDGSDPVRRFG